MLAAARAPVDKAAAGPAASLTALAELRTVRQALDAAERQLITLAREHGIAWVRIARALGLRSRQAAEQRWLRLQAASAPEAGDGKRQRHVDTPEDPFIAQLRSATANALRRIDGDPDWDGRDPRAELARASLEAAAEAPAGALFSLVDKAIADVEPFRSTIESVDLRRAIGLLREALLATGPSSYWLDRDDLVEPGA